jgi:hypothetical protein
MRKVLILGIITLAMVACLASAALAYHLEVNYAYNANFAYGYINNDEVLVGISSSQYSSGTATAQQSYTGPDSFGKDVTQQTVSPYDNWNKIIINKTTAGPISDNNYFADGLGYGDTFFLFKIVKDSGDIYNKVYVTIGYKIDGSYNFGDAGGSNNYFLGRVRYAAQLYDYPTAGLEQPILGSYASPKSKTWNGSNISGTFSDQGELVNFIMDVNTDYYFYGMCESVVRGYAANYNLPGVGSVDFDAYVRFKDISAVPLPGTLVLLSSGLLGLLRLSRRQ